MNNLTKAQYSVCISLVVVLMVLFAPNTASADATVDINTGTTITTQTGESFYMPVNIDSTEDLYSFSFEPFNNHLIKPTFSSTTWASANNTKQVQY